MMKNKKIPKPTESELEILQILWQNGPSTVRDVHEELAAHKDIRYTTTLKNMQNMVQKDMLTRDEESRSHIYKPVLQQSETQKMLLDRFLDNTFGGSAMSLVMQALGHRKTSKEELEQIKALINKLEGGNK